MKILDIFWEHLTTKTLKLNLIYKVCGLQDLK